VPNDECFCFFPRGFFAAEVVDDGASRSEGKDELFSSAGFFYCQTDEK
jgi:hypothetical protein